MNQMLNREIQKFNLSLLETFLNSEVKNFSWRGNLPINEFYWILEAYERLIETTFNFWRNFGNPNPYFSYHSSISSLIWMRRNKSHGFKIWCYKCIEESWKASKFLNWKSFRRKARLRFWRLCRIPSVANVGKELFAC